jgi:RimJ/RimL family protein N-acetyltransferase
MDDVELCARWFANPEVHRYTRSGRAPDREGIERFVRWLVARAQSDGPRFHVLERLADGIAIGYAGLKGVDDWPVGDDQAPPPVYADVELGYVIDPAWWGHGYATEAAEAALRDGFTRLDLDVIIARTHPDNRRSIAVMQRQGMTYAGDELLGATPTVRYRIERATWEARDYDR